MYLMLKWIVKNRTVFDIGTVLTLKGIIWNWTFFKKKPTYTVLLNGIAWNRNIFEN